MLPAASLALLPIPTGCFSFWIINFITALLNDQGFYAILTCINKLAMLVRFIPCVMGKGVLLAEAIACLFYDSILRLYSIPTTVLYE